MVYDPQANRRRPHPETSDPVPVDALLGATSEPTSAQRSGVTDDPPPTPAVTPPPADPPSDIVLLNTGLAAAAVGIVTLLTVRHLWNRRRRSKATPTAD
jgi:hypothetical protein